jgi:hypothetical protein
MKNTKIVELIIEESNEALAVDCISLVSAPAIEQGFVYFGKEKHNLTFAKVDEEKRMLVSPALIPNKQIFRYDPQKDQEYYVYFSPETVRRASELYLKHNNHHKATYEHQDRVSGVLTTESWIIEDSKKDKSTLYGFSLPKGTWMVKMKIENDELWQEIKSGNLKGLSIEGYFIDKMQEMSKVEPTDEEILIALNEIIKESKTELKAEKVELGLVDDMSSLDKSLAKLWDVSNKNIDLISDLDDKVEQLQKKAEGLLKDLKSDSSKMNKERDNGKKLLSNFEKATKELGVKADDSAEYKRLSKRINEAYEHDNTIKDWIRVATQITKI